MARHNPAPRFLVKEREFMQLSKPLAYSGKRVARFTPWQTIGSYLTFEDARAQRGARITGLFERVVFYRGVMILDPQGVQTVCGPPGHARPCTCPKKPDDQRVEEK